MEPHIVIPDQRPAAERGRGRWQIHLRSILKAVAVAGVCFAALRFTGLSLFALWGILFLLVAALMFGAVMGLGWMGFRLFAYGDGFLAWLRRLGGWPPAELTPHDGPPPQP